MTARLVPAAALAAALLAAAPARAAGPPDPLALYGREMVFSVWRSGSEIGRHRVLFARENGTPIEDVCMRCLASAAR